MAKTATITAPSPPAPKERLMRLRVSSGHSHVTMYGALGLSPQDAKGLAEDYARLGVWVTEDTYWPAHSITSITLEPITP